MILNRSFGLLEKSGQLSKFRTYREASQDIQAMKIAWNDRMRKMEEEGNLKKDELNNHIEDIKYKDLEFLKKRGGPFTTVEEVKEFDRNTNEDPDKNTRLYTEVRYAKKLLRISPVQPHN